MSIPNEYHFVFGLVPDFGGKPFSLIHYVAVAACRAVNRPDAIHFYYTHEPQGKWWDLARPYVDPIHIEPPEDVFGTPLLRHEHMADVLRLQILQQRGGIYLDMDVICLRPFSPLLEHSVVMGEECGVGLCNAVILASPGAPFLKRWLGSYSTFSNEEWNVHSVIVPKRLVDEAPGEVHLLDHRKFFWPMHWNEHMEFFVEGHGTDFCAESFCVHLWEAATWDRYLKVLTPLQLWTRDSELCRLLRPYIPLEVS